MTTPTPPEGGKLLPCPFCKDDLIYRNGMDHAEHPRNFSCFLSSQKVSADRFELWNTRAS